MYLKGLKLEVTLHSLHSNCKNLQKSVLTNVNIQRTAKTFLQILWVSLQKYSPLSVPRIHFCPSGRFCKILNTNCLWCVFYFLHGENNFSALESDNEPREMGGTGVFSGARLGQVDLFCFHRVHLFMGKQLLISVLWFEVWARWKAF